MIRHVVLDLDGTVYKGGTVLPGSLPFLKGLAERGVAATFLTNNTSRSVRDYVDKLTAMGIPATAEQILTPTASVAAHLHSEQVSSLFVLGTSALRAEFTAAGFIVLDGDGQPDAVVVGFDTELTYAALCRAAWWIDQGAPFYATHPDRICPTDQATMLPDCGALCAALTTATGREPDRVFGKPDPAMLEVVVERTGVPVHEIAMVGDRLYTDIVLGRRAGAVSVLVLTGEAQLTDLASLCLAETVPDLVCTDLLAFGNLL